MQTTDTQSLSDDQLKSIAKQVVPEVMNVIKPLVDKLHLAMQQQQQEMQGMPGLSAGVNSGIKDYTQKVSEMQAATLERIKQQELKVAERMNRIQKRLGGFGQVGQPNQGNDASSE